MDGMKPFPPHEGPWAQFRHCTVASSPNVEGVAQVFGTASIPRAGPPDHPTCPTTN